jgi:hypothetical protein
MPTYYLKIKGDFSLPKQYEKEIKEKFGDLISGSSKSDEENWNYILKTENKLTQEERKFLKSHGLEFKV